MPGYKLPKWRADDPELVRFVQRSMNHMLNQIQKSSPRDRDQALKAMENLCRTTRRENYSSSSSSSSSDSDSDKETISPLHLDIMRTIPPRRRAESFVKSAVQALAAGKVDVVEEIVTTVEEVLPDGKKVREEEEREEDVRYAIGMPDAKEVAAFFFEEIIGLVPSAIQGIVEAADGYNNNKSRGSSSGGGGVSSSSLSSSKKWEGLPTRVKAVCRPLNELVAMAEEETITTIRRNMLLAKLGIAFDKLKRELIDGEEKAKCRKALDKFASKQKKKKNKESETATTLAQAALCRIVGCDKEDLRAFLEDGYLAHALYTVFGPGAIALCPGVSEAASFKHPLAAHQYFRLIRSADKREIVESIAAELEELVIQPIEDNEPFGFDSRALDNLPPSASVEKLFCAMEKCERKS